MEQLPHCYPFRLIKKNQTDKMGRVVRGISIYIFNLMSRLCDFFQCWDITHARKRFPSKLHPNHVHVSCIHYLCLCSYNLNIHATHTIHISRHSDVFYYLPVWRKMLYMSRTINPMKHSMF